jgi:hypothetical protein
MNKFLKMFFVLTLTLASCGWNSVDPAKARAVAENFLTDQKNEKYENINNYFTASFNESEPLEKKTEKLQKIKEVIGAIESFELKDSKETSNGLDDIPTIQLTYKVKYARATAEQMFIIINDGGTHCITFQNIETKN